ncbi:hypothetical protein BDY19DRAFT_944425 [Irpex rosettiformis]|uniref:Uncharacterized protein n=1 Tax=Irpex rosettiformis TaxID=378272 RepID=A0ACB8U4E3_9APHY|nr:hypothetical protein BDY19DRAFT_944425 [Irpex rosettiformis]
MSAPPVILYIYHPSLFSRKAQNLLTIKKVPHLRVNVSPMLPRPEITDLLGIKYRRIPLLAIGNDVYCDTSLIGNALERRFPSSEEYGTLFPFRVGSQRADTGLVKLLATYWTEKILFGLAVGSYSLDQLSPELLADRVQYLGAAPDVEALKATQGPRTSTFASHLALIEEQLSDGRQWLLDTEVPGLVDIDVHFMVSWVQPESGVFRSLAEIFDPTVVPKTLEWLARVTEYLKQQNEKGVASFSEISAEEAAKLIVAAPCEDEKSVGFVEVEARRLGVGLGDLVSVVPTDNAKIASVGRLVALNRNEVIIEVTGSVGAIRLHFPRLEFSIAKV